MGNTIFAKMIYFWIFILGGMFFTYILGFARDPADFIVILLSLSLVYWGLAFVRFKGQQKREQSKGKRREETKKKKR